MSTVGRAPRAAGVAAAARRRAVSLFRYQGRTALSVRGPATGRLYRFARPGAMVGVDPRDAPSLARVPQLGWVAGT